MKRGTLTNNENTPHKFKRASSSPLYITPNGSPHKSSTKYRPDGGDRYIPMRESRSSWATKFAALTATPLLDMNVVYLPSSSTSTETAGPSNAPTSQSNINTISMSTDTNTPDMLAHRALLKNELLNHSIVDIRGHYNEDYAKVEVLERQKTESLYRFGHRTPQKYGLASSSTNAIFRKSPFTSDSMRLLKSPRKPRLRVAPKPYKVLDAPELREDFYVNLVDWSSRNVLSVALSYCIYLYNVTDSQVMKLCDLSSQLETPTSLNWTTDGRYLAVGTQKGNLQIWDIEAQRTIRVLKDHHKRIGCLAWNGELISSGSRDCRIINRDIRDCASCPAQIMDAHVQEVCGLKWSPNLECLASGGTDNQLLLWSLGRSQPLQTHTEHNSAVKALAWSPHHPGMLVSGAGRLDCSLRFWNTLTGQMMRTVDTGSQVCNVAWSKHSAELVSTHGPPFNGITLWSYPEMEPKLKLKGHNQRVLYLAMSPDGSSIVTGAGDETIRFWNVFTKQTPHRLNRSALDLHASLR